MSGLIESIMFIINQSLNERLVKDLSAHLSNELGVDNTRTEHALLNFSWNETLSSKAVTTVSAVTSPAVPSATAATKPPKKKMTRADTVPVQKSKESTFDDLNVKVQKAKDAGKYYCTDTKRPISKNKNMQEKYEFHDDVKIAGKKDSDELNRVLKMFSSKSKDTSEEKPKALEKALEKAPKKPKTLEKPKSKTSEKAPSKDSSKSKTLEKSKPKALEKPPSKPSIYDDMPGLTKTFDDESIDLDNLDEISDILSDE